MPACGPDGTVGAVDDPVVDGVESLEITIDAVDVEAAARFWAGALGYERLYERPPYVVLGPTGRSWPRLVVQEVAAASGAERAGSISTYGSETRPPKSAGSKRWARRSTRSWRKRARAGR